MTNYEKTRTIPGGRYDLPPVVYKYRKWDANGKRILLENRIFLASPSSFDDILDCNGPQSFPNPNELYDFFYNKSVQERPHLSHQEHVSHARRWAVESPLARPEIRDELVAEKDAEFFEQFGVFSSTANPSIERMWDEYSDGGTGICIGFNPELLSQVVGGAGPCIYVDELPVMKFGVDENIEQFYKRVIYKKTEYQFEEEYRIHKMWPRPASPADRAILLPPGTIIEVILGPNMTPENKEEAVQIIHRHHPQAIIRQH